VFQRTLKTQLNLSKHPKSQASCRMWFVGAEAGGQKSVVVSAWGGGRGWGAWAVGAFTQKNGVGVLDLRLVEPGS
jgi:hypothetical protein